VPLIVIQRQLGHSDLAITSVSLQGIDNAEIIETVHARRQPMIPVSTSRPHEDRPPQLIAQGSTHKCERPGSS
jgi:hypothetical protein